MILRSEFKKQGDFLFKHRSYLPLIILVVGVVLYVQDQEKFNILNESQRKIYELVCFGVCLLGLLIRVITIGYSDDKTSGRNTLVGQVAESINTSGPYSTCRHPLYLGNFFMWLGIAAFTQNFWFLMAFCLFYWVYYERIMYAEEDFLISKFGDAYVNYAASTSIFIPDFSKWTTPVNKFSLRKVIRQEKAGILNLFGVILFMRVLGAYFSSDLKSVEMYWIICFVLSVLWYVVIKIIQKTTHILAEGR